MLLSWPVGRSCPFLVPALHPLPVQVPWTAMIRTWMGWQGVSTQYRGKSWKSDNDQWNWINLSNNSTTAPPLRLLHSITVQYCTAPKRENQIKAAILITNIGTVEPKLTLFSVQCPATKALGAFSPHAPRHLFVALQLLLRMPPASPFTASPFDLVINPGQRANGPVRLGYTPPSGARDCDRKINGEP